ncbi:hypothetical protein ABZX95_14145 [Streptomyces sp. NPDC004232]|uniref:hypothetical protein n=1 Tax=Streptomyces sp. NPDC004232 TaxID=3154454 RepID=UPI00339FC16A
MHRKTGGREWADEHGYCVRKVWKENLSAWSDVQRPKYDAAMSAVLNGLYTGTYDCTTIEDHDVVVPRSVSVKEQREQRQFPWHHSTFINDITVRVIQPHEADRTPRVERLRCTVEPVDASKPSYTGDPHDRSRLKIGPDQEGTDAGSLSGLFSNDGQQLCQDRITILVPDGSIQP